MISTEKRKYHVTIMVFGLKKKELYRAKMTLFELEKEKLL